MGSASLEAGCGAQETFHLWEVVLVPRVKDVDKQLDCRVGRASGEALDMTWGYGDRGILCHGV